jgi:hypothetical protein
MNQNEANDNEKEIDAALEQALMETGAILPTNEEAVKAVEKRQAEENEESPFEISFEEVMERVEGEQPSESKIIEFKPPVPRPALEGLARAARKGEELPSDIQAKMEADRQRTENQDQ